MPRIFPSRRSTLRQIGSGLVAASTMNFSACSPPKKALRPNLIVWHAFRGGEKGSLEKLYALYFDRQKPSQREVQGAIDALNGKKKA